MGLIKTNILLKSLPKSICIYHGAYENSDIKLVHFTFSAVNYINLAWTVIALMIQR